MSDFFKKQNTAEFGPGPFKEVWWLVVDPSDSEMTRICYVMGKSAIEARRQAEKYIPELSNKAVFYPNTVRYPSER
jgi:hypothetical protein